MENVKNIRVAERSFGFFCIAEDPDFPRFHITSPVFTTRDIANRMAREAEGQPVRDHAWTRNARAARMAAELWGEKTEA